MKDHAAPLCRPLFDMSFSRPWYHNGNLVYRQQFQERCLPSWRMATTTWYSMLVEPLQARRPVPKKPWLEMRVIVVESARRQLAALAPSLPNRAKCSRNVSVGQDNFESRLWQH